MAELLKLLAYFAHTPALSLLSNQQCKHLAKRRFPASSSPLRTIISQIAQNPKHNVSIHESIICYFFETYLQEPTESWPKLMEAVLVSSEEGE